MTMGEEEDEELYADLYEHLGDGRQVPKTSLLEMEERMDQLSKQADEMQTKLQTLQKQNNSLQQDKDVLIRNISCLFKTAQMEVARKNKQINELRQEISQLKMQAPHAESPIPAEAQITTKPEKLLQGGKASPCLLVQQEPSGSQAFDSLRKGADLQARGCTKSGNHRGNHSPDLFFSDGYSGSRKGGRDFIEEQECCEKRSRAEHHSSGAERDKDKRKDRHANRFDDKHTSRNSEIHILGDRNDSSKPFPELIIAPQPHESKRREREQKHIEREHKHRKTQEKYADVERKMDRRECVYEDGEIPPSKRHSSLDRIAKERGKRHCFRV